MAQQRAKSFRIMDRPLRRKFHTKANFSSTSLFPCWTADASIVFAACRKMERKKRMNALLIYPEFPDTFWSFKRALEFVGKKTALPPLGLLTIASMLPREWSLRLVDKTCERHVS